MNAQNDPPEFKSPYTEAAYMLFVMIMGALFGLFGALLIILIATVTIAAVPILAIAYVGFWVYWHARAFWFPTPELIEARELLKVAKLRKQTAERNYELAMAQLNETAAQCLSAAVKKSESKKEPEKTPITPNRSFDDHL